MVFFEKTTTMSDTICFFLPKKYPTLTLEHIQKLKSTFPSLKDEDILTIENEVVFWNDPQFPIWTGCIICGEKKKYAHSNPTYSYPYESDEKRFKEEYPNGIVLE